MKVSLAAVLKHKCREDDIYHLNETCSIPYSHLVWPDELPDDVQYKPNKSWKDHVTDCDFYRRAPIARYDDNISDNPIF